MHRAQLLTAHLTNGQDSEILYIANRGIPALRIARTAKRLGFRVVGGYCKSETNELFVKAFDQAVCLEEDGPSAYTNIPNVIKTALSLRAKFVHPGIGFLSESGEFARACAQAGLVFIGPSADCLDLFGNKLKTCALATQLQVPNLALGRVDGGVLSHEQKSNLPILLKATNGGGGIGLRLIETAEQASDMYKRCLSEAKRAFASSDDTEICAEVYLSRARHVEVQLVGDGQQFICLGDRECSVQRKFQKIIEIAPCPAISDFVRQGIAACAVRIAHRTAYRGVGTFEFLVQDNAFFFIECNPRLQVEHTVTEEIFRGLDLVAVQLKLARGARLHEALPAMLPCFGTAIQMRVCAETYSPQGGVLPIPANARIVAIDLPSGNFRIETSVKSGCIPNPKFDSLVAQLIVFEESFEKCCLRCVEVLNEFRIVGCPNNINLLRTIVQHPHFLQHQLITSFLDSNFPALLSTFKDVVELHEIAVAPVLSHLSLNSPEVVEGNSLIVSSQMQAHVVSVSVNSGESVVGHKTVLVVLSALKMEHEIRCSRSGTVEAIFVQVGDVVEAGSKLCQIVLNEEIPSQSNVNTEVVDVVTTPLFEQFYVKVKYSTLDSSRPDKTAARLRDPSRLTARQLLAEIFDQQQTEYGRLASNGYQKHSVGDGLYVVKGLINQSELPERPQAMVLAYDYTVLAGTQGLIGHKKKDRAFLLAMKERLPVVLFAEGGGGRAGDAKVGGFTSSGLDGPAFTLFAKLSVAKIPLIGAVSGFCFAGNAALLGTCDVLLATKSVSLGMGGPAMIEGGGLGIVKPEDVGPVDMHFKRGVIDVVVDDDLALVAVSKKVLGYFQGRTLNWKPRSETPDQISQVLRNLVPVNNRRLAFSIETAIQYVFDADSVLILKSAFARNLLTCFARLEGYPVGVLANDCRFVSGTLDANASAKAAAFLRLCSKHLLPVVVFCDTPGFLVGVESEKESLVKRAGELFITGASLAVPLISVIVRRCVGLGGQAMCGGDLKAPNLCVAWPTGEFGAMGFEGAVKLGFRTEIKNNPEIFDQLVATAYEKGKALNIADHFDIDDVIDPADTREVIRNALFPRTQGITKSGS